MRIRHLKIAAMIGVVAALTMGSVALANQSSSAPVKQTPAATTAVDTDNVQVGDQTTPDTKAEAAEESTTDAAKVDTDTDNVQVQEGDQNAADDKAEAAGAETAGSEVPGDDGPGGHADEPGNATADHQFNGQE